jgi:hypothetical protein
MNRSDKTKELAALCKYRSARISDVTIAIAHLISAGEWDKLAQSLPMLQQDINLLAGLVAQLLPVSKSKG